MVCKCQNEHFRLWTNFMWDLLTRILVLKLKQGKESSSESFAMKHMWNIDCWNRVTIAYMCINNTYVICAVVYCGIQGIDVQQCIVGYNGYLLSAHLVPCIKKGFGKTKLLKMYRFSKDL